MPSYITILGNSNLPEDRFYVGGEQMLAIASHDNNPDSLAARIQHRSERVVTATGELLYSGEPRVAVKIYHVAGSDNPLLISYIPEEGNDFIRRLTELHGKNEQIQLLKQILAIKGFADETTHYHFLDVEPSAVRLAQTLPQVDARHFADCPEVSPLHAAKTIIRCTDLVHSGGFSRSDATALANVTGLVVLRESTSAPDTIVATYPEACTPYHTNLTQIITDALRLDPTHFSTPENAQRFLTWRLGSIIAPTKRLLASLRAAAYGPRAIPIHESGEEVARWAAETDRSKAIDAALAHTSHPRERFLIKANLVLAEDMLKRTGWVDLSLTPLQAEQLANRTGSIVLSQDEITLGIVATYPKTKLPYHSRSPHIALTELILSALKHDPECFRTPEKAVGVLRTRLGRKPPVHQASAAMAAARAPAAASAAGAAAAASAAGAAGVNPHGLYGNRAAASAAAAAHQAAAASSTAGAGVNPHGLYGNRAAASAAAATHQAVASNRLADVVDAAKEMLRRTGFVYPAGSLSRESALKLANDTYSAVLRESGSARGMIVVTRPEASLTKGQVAHQDLTKFISDECARRPESFSNPDTARAFLAGVNWGEGVTPPHTPASESRTYGDFDSPSPSS